MKQFFKFVFIGILFAAPGEFLGHIIIHNSWYSYFLTMLSYAIFYLPLFYILSSFFKKIIKNEFNWTLFCYIFFGLFGLGVEWFLIHNSPWENPGASQVGMFTFWATLFIGPTILVNLPLASKLKQNFLRYWIFYSLIFVLPPLIFHSGKIIYLSIIVYSFGIWIFNYFYIRYLYFLKHRT